MSISDSLAVLRGVRDQIRDAIDGKGGSLPVGSPMGSYAQAITDLPSGSGGDAEIPFRSRLMVPEDTDPWHLTSLTATQVGSYAFHSDRSLTSVSLPAATSIGTQAFRDCISLTSVSLPLVTSIGINAFTSCSSLTSADFPVATSTGNYTFFGCSSLTSVSLPAATSIGTQAFRDCISLTSADFPVATDIGTQAFYGCSALTSADFPVATSTGNQAFYGCSRLVSLTLSNTTITTLSNTNALLNTPIANGTGHIYVPDNLVDQYKTSTNWATYANQIMPLSQKP